MTTRTNPASGQNELMPGDKITQQAAHHAIAARLSCDTQSVDEAASLYIAAVSTNDQGLEVTVMDEHGHTRTVNLAS